MRKAAVTFLGVWVLNSFLLLAYYTNRPLYNMFVEAGVPLYNCIDWDEDGHVVPGVCSQPMPEGWQ